MNDHSATLAAPDRLAALASYDVDHPELRRRLDELSARTAATLGQPIGMVSLVLDSAQILAGAHGLTGWLEEVRGTPVEWSFCANAVVDAAPYLVPDTARDARQQDNPLVTVEGIASYAGAPLVSAEGHVLGAHCVLGTTVHRFTAEEVAVLETSAAAAVSILEEYRHRA